MSSVIVVVGAGSIGQAIARRVSAGKHVMLADLRPENATAAAKVLDEAGFDVSTATARLPAFQARQFPAGHGRGRAVGQARRPRQYDQPRHRHHAAGQG